jgi:hypothetical protein
MPVESHTVDDSNYVSYPGRSTTRRGWFPKSLDASFVASVKDAGKFARRHLSLSVDHSRGIYESVAYIGVGAGL